MVENKVTNSYLKHFAIGNKTSIAASAAAVVTVTLGYPFDFIKTRMQVSPVPTTFNSTFKSIVESEGYLALWRGVAAPLALVSVLKSLTFTSYQMSNLHLKNLQERVNGKQEFNLINNLPVFLMSGTIAGSITCCISSPMELVKIQVQVSKYGKGNKPANSGVINVIKTIATEHGPLSFYKGFSAHLLRDGFGTAIYFGTYEALKHLIQSSNYFLNAGLGPSSLLAGGLAGSLSWVCLFPIDFIKTRLQREAFLPNKLYNNSILQCAKIIYQQQGIRAFYQGLPPTLIRALPIHSLNFFVYEQALKFIDGLS